MNTTGVLNNYFAAKIDFKNHGPKLAGMKVKMFQEGSDYKNVEATINAWLAENPGIKIVSTSQSESGDEPGKWTMITTIFYEIEATAARKAGTW